MTRRISNPKFESQIRNSCRSTIGTLFTLGGVERDDVVTLKKKVGSSEWEDSATEKSVFGIDGDYFSDEKNLLQVAQEEGGFPDVGCVLR